MSLMQDYSVLLGQIAEQHENWSVKTESPFTISRHAQEHTLPLSISVYGSDAKAHLFFNIYDDGPFTGLAKKVLHAQQKEKIQKEDEDSGLVIIIDTDGFAVVFDATDVKTTDFAAQFNQIIETADKLLMQLVASAHDTVKDMPDEPAASPSTAQAPQIAQGNASSVDEVVQQYLKEKDYKYNHDEKNKRFIFGFSTENYVNRNADQSLQIVIDYSDDDLLRFETPWLYKFDFKQTEYSLIASVMAWFQFEFKFLSMSLDPSDGELKISIDIPLGKGTIHTTQVHRMVAFILQFSESTYKELFSILLTDSKAAEKQLKKLIDDHKATIENRTWLKSLESKLSSLTDEQKQAIEAILEQGEHTSDQNGI
ncbi:hypothetical protein [Alteromonas sp. C1M14]|uniref:hypothetical protein n=1 Tax=Alteromonas sp. C1M14 TaxID=2841567 RepID=UPI001C0919B7|nr:hypothetical protein [Alteromonas sp. C1M14]MBU2978564.1 hypothetical protein [Alteromonas sp. C1M14]